MNSNPNSFLPGALIAGCSFLVLWAAFYVLIAFGMMQVGWLELFRPAPWSWLKDAADVCGGALLSFLSLRILARRIMSRPE
jgi:hypothetical protein